MMVEVYPLISRKDNDIYTNELCNKYNIKTI